MRFKHKFSFDKRRKLQSGKYPIKVNLHSYSDNKNYYFSIPALFLSNERLEFSCSDIEEFKSVWTNRHKKDSFGAIVGETTVYGSKMELRVGLKIQYDRLNSILEDGKNNTVNVIKKLFAEPKDITQENKERTTNVWKAFNDYRDKLNSEERFKYAVSINSSKLKLYEFHSKENFDLLDIDVDFLNRFEKFMQNQDKAKATIGVYVRNIRTILNAVIGNKHDSYPFGKGKYIIPEGSRKNQGLSKQDISKIIKYSSDNHYLQTARDYFLFCFYNGGMNIKDVVLLKKGQTEFKRQKSIRTAKKEIIIPLKFNKITEDIIERHKGEGSYMFNIISDGDNALERIKKADGLNKFLRPQLMKLSKLLELEYLITANWSRHSNTTILFNEGINLKAISEGLGHTSLKTTEGYIDTMINKEQSKIDEALNFDDD